MVCVADQNGDGKMGIDEFKVHYSKMLKGDTSSSEPDIGCVIDGNGDGIVEEVTDSSRSELTKFYEVIFQCVKSMRSNFCFHV